MQLSVGAKKIEKIVLVTGASAGIGQEICEFLKLKNCVVYCASRLLKDNLQNKTFSLDVSDKERAKQIISQIISLHGRIDVLINVAGCGIAGPIEDTPFEAIEKQMNVNFMGTVILSKAVLEYMRKKRSGLIINFSSIGGLFGLPYQAFYCASKFAVNGFSQALRLEVEQFGIKVVVIEPGNFKSNFTLNRTKHVKIDSIYQQAFNNAIKTIEKDEKYGQDPIKIAQLVYKIITSKKPKPTYIIGPYIEKIFAYMAKLFPEKLINIILRNYYGQPK